MEIVKTTTRFPDVTVETYKRALLTEKNGREARKQMSVELLRLCSTIAKYYNSENSASFQSLHQAVLFAETFNYIQASRVPLNEVTPGKMKDYFQTCLKASANLKKERYLELIQEGLNLLPEDNFEVFY